MTECTLTLRAQPHKPARARAEVDNTEHYRERLCNGTALFRLYHEKNSAAETGKNSPADGLLFAMKHYRMRMSRRDCSFNSELTEAASPSSRNALFGVHFTPGGPRYRIK